MGLPTILVLSALPWATGYFAYKALAASQLPSDAVGYWTLLLFIAAGAFQIVAMALVRVGHDIVAELHLLRLHYQSESGRS